MDTNSKLHRLAIQIDAVRSILVDIDATLDDVLKDVKLPGSVGIVSNAYVELGNLQETVLGIAD